MRWFILGVLVTISGSLISAEKEYHSDDNSSEDAIYIMDRLVELSSSVEESREENKNLRAVVLELNDAENLARSETTIAMRESILNLTNSVADLRATLDNFQAIGERLDSADAKLIALAEKLDAEDVTSIDTDYAATLGAL